MQFYLYEGWKKVGDEEASHSPREPHHPARTGIQEDENSVQDYESEAEHYFEDIVCFLGVSLILFRQGCHDLLSGDVGEDGVDCDQVDSQGKAEDIGLPFSLEIPHH